MAAIKPVSDLRDYNKVLSVKKDFKKTTEILLKLIAH